MLTAITILGWTLFLAITFYGLYRGSSAMLCTGVLLVCATLLASQVAPTLAAMNPGTHQHAIISQGYWQLFLSLCLGALAFPLGAYLNRYLQWSIDPFDHLLGLLLGMFTGGMLIHFVLAGILLISHGSPDYKQLDNLFIVRQLVYMDGWKSFTLWIKTLGNAQGTPSVE